MSVKSAELAMLSEAELRAIPDEYVDAWLDEKLLTTAHRLLDAYREVTSACEECIEATQDFALSVEAKATPLDEDFTKLGNLPAWSQVAQAALDQAAALDPHGEELKKRTIFFSADGVALYQHRSRLYSFMEPEYEGRAFRAAVALGLMSVRFPG
jgi:hypothetical protein